MNSIEVIYICACTNVSELLTLFNLPFLAGRWVLKCNGCLTTVLELEPVVVLCVL